ncbi:hypothetical protein LCGC14_1170770 [marine sediment metagenome]|uniref:Uncharacterized protein n=1 Tax=marine sediment metagenome TaxID=412755 RepID=A0A0F9LUR8_9ZZZZ
MLLEVGSSHYKINDLGFVSGSILGNEIDNIYSIAFKEHSLVDPTCPHLSNNEEIFGLHQEDNKVTYSKYFGEYLTQSNIHFYEDGFDWTITFTKNRPIFHRFGLSIPYPGKSLQCLDTEVSHNIANYHVLYHKNLREQFTIQFPIINTNDWVYFGPTDYGMQFFLYKESTNSRIRVTTLTSETAILNVSLRRSAQKPQQIYIDKYPATKFDILPQKQVRELISQKYSIETELLQSVQRTFSSLPNQKDVSGWMDLVRTCRHPKYLWLIDYIEKTDTLIEIEKLIRQSEDILYDSKTSICLKEPYKADVNQEVCFHTIRTYLRYEDGDFDTAEYIWEKLLSDLYDDITPIRQINLLFHCFIFYMFTKQFNKAYECFEKHWIILKHSSSIDRFSEGMWDNFSIMHIVLWFFIDYVEDFVYFFAAKNNLDTFDIIRHKKVSFINFMKADISWIVSLATPALYNYGLTIMSNLPEYHGYSFPLTANFEEF